MVDIEAGSHAFVIRIWLEDGARGSWRGHVTHVPSGADRYFAELDDMVEFVRRYMRPAAPDGGG